MAVDKPLPLDLGPKMDTFQREGRKRREKTGSHRHLFERLPETKLARRHEASEIGADMEMGYYLDLAGEQWPPQHFIVKEIMTKMKYGPWFIRSRRWPAWWPGMEGFRRLVAWKVYVRRMQSTLDFGSEDPATGPLRMMAIEDMGRRLAEDPRLISDRDLTDLITKVSRDARRRVSLANIGDAPAGTVRLRRITEEIELLPEGAARERAMRDLEAARTRVLEQLPARAAAK
jgi:hypothetical protein